MSSAHCCEEPKRHTFRYLHGKLRAKISLGILPRYYHCGWLGNQVLFLGDLLPIFTNFWVRSRVDENPFTEQLVFAG